MFLLNENQLELNQEFDETCLEDEYYLLYKLNQQYRLKIDNIHVFERISKKKLDQISINIKKVYRTTDGKDVSALISTKSKLRLW
jgi:hypothetical protein